MKKKMEVMEKLLEKQTDPDVEEWKQKTANAENKHAKLVQVLNNTNRAAQKKDAAVRGDLVKQVEATTKVKTKMAREDFVRNDGALMFQGYWSKMVVQEFLAMGTTQFDTKDPYWNFNQDGHRRNIPEWASDSFINQDGHCVPVQEWDINESGM